MHRLVGTAFGARRNAVSRWLSHRQRFGLAEGQRAGHPSKLPGAAQQLRRFVPRLADGLGLRVSARTLRRLARALGCAWKRCRRSLKATRPRASVPYARTCAACTRPKQGIAPPWCTSTSAASRVGAPCPTPNRYAGPHPCPYRPGAKPTGSRCSAPGSPGPLASH